MELINGDCLEVMKGMEDNSVSAIVTDPPYGLNFMGKKWDYDVPSVEIWKECLRVLKHGGFLLSFSGTKTYHRMTINIEDAGFEIRDMISWLYGSGFPKSLNIGKQVDKIQGNKREVIGEKIRGDVQKAKENGNTFAVADANKNNNDIFGYGKEIITKGNSEWEGWGTALKPACEPIVVARKPLFEKNVALNVLKWGTGGINIDDCRVETNGDKWYEKGYPHKTQGYENSSFKIDYKRESMTNKLGRFPANIIFDEEASRILDEQTGELKSGSMKKSYEYTNNGYSLGKPTGSTKQIHESNKGGASRFFYCAKASKSERNLGCDILTTIKLIKQEDIELLWKEENMELVQLLLKGISGLEVMSLNIGEFGENIMVMCQKECLFTTKTTINKITELKTWNLLMQSLTEESIQDVNLKMENGLNPVKFVENLRRLMIRTGISQEKVGLIMEDVKNVTYRLLLKLKEREEDWQDFKNNHSTVKPIKLMQYLVRLVTPKNAICLDPFMGSGSTGIACMKENINFIGIEKEEDYIKIAEARINNVKVEDGV